MKLYRAVSQVGIMAVMQGAEAFVRHASGNSVGTNGFYTTKITHSFEGNPLLNKSSGGAWQQVIKKADNLLAIRFLH